MDANMSAFKRRFNRAMLELGKSQASCTARRLVGQTIQAMEKRTTTSHPTGGDKRTSLGRSNLPKPIQQERRQFRYTFAPSNHNGHQRSSEILRQRQQQQAASNSSELHFELQQQQQQDHGRRVVGAEPEAVKYRQYYDELNYNDIDDHIKKESENSLPAWRHISQDHDDDYFDVEYLATRETMLPNEETKTQLEMADDNGNRSSFSRAHQNRNSVRSLRRRSAKFRQVRFQPIPQSIDISIVSEEPSITTTPVKQIKSKKHHLIYKPKHLKRKLNSNLSHMNAQLNKITLKGFNNIAHRFQQTLLRADSSKQSGGVLQQQSSTSKTDASGSGPDDDDIGWGSDFDDQSAESSLTIEQQQHHYHSHQQPDYLLEIGKSSQDTNAISDVINGQGISGQFKKLDTSGSESPAACCEQKTPSPDSITAQTCDISTSTTVDVSNSPSQDGGEEEEEEDLRSLEERQGFNHIRDKLKSIFDQRLLMAAENSSSSIDSSNHSGSHSKKLDTSGSKSPPACKQETLSPDSAAQDCNSSSTIDSNSPSQVEEDKDDDDEGKDLRSLEERQGFNHIRDKLKIFFDQRLLSTTENSSSSGGGGGSNHSGGGQFKKPLDTSGNESPASCEQKTPSLDVSSAQDGNASSTIDCNSLSQDEEEDLRSLEERQGFNHIRDKLKSIFDQRLLMAAENSSTSSDDSTHSESQDSGHSTHHSAYSATSSSSCLPMTTTNSTLMNRQQLLEQQRQMSLKLKQKPRRKAANRHWKNSNNLINTNNQQQPDEQTPSQQQSCDQETARVENSSYGLRPAMSLRQLVTDLIDDYERPPPVPVLTAGHEDDDDDELQRQSPNYPAHLAINSNPNLQPQFQQIIIADQSMSSLGTIDGLEYHEQPSFLADDQASYNVQEPAASSQHTFGGSINKPLKNYIIKSFKDFSRFKMPNWKLTTATNANATTTTSATTTTMVKHEARTGLGQRARVLDYVGTSGSRTYSLPDDLF